ncbi:MAG: exodeoxyribonuclease VII large subunit [Clostridium sp.]|nr:exodeoxyribonuclease VII large subunit [Clostridium sp.]
MEALTLYELNALVRGTLEAGLRAPIWLQAELSEVRCAYNGHCYLEFVQKDKHGRSLVAKARGVIWAGTYALLALSFERETGQPLAAGMKVLVRVSVSFHELYGYSLTVTDMDPTYTLGDLARRRREILQQLEADGILTDNRDLPFPVPANRIAVISSATAAGYGDFCNQLAGNEYGFRFTTRLFPAVMQGERVEETVLAALDAVLAARDDWDVVVIIRGGGATSDLSGFDSYLLAAACAQFPLPVITGIGHERDDTVLDCVAHRRVKTPTAAAAFLIDRMLGLADRLEQLRTRLTTAALQRMQGERAVLQRHSLQLNTLFTRAVDRMCHGMDLRVQRLQSALHRRLQSENHRADTAWTRLCMCVDGRLQRERIRLDMWWKQCDAADPVHLLKRGYTLTTKDGKPVCAPADVQAGDEITTRTAGGEIRSVVQ